MTSIRRNIYAARLIVVATILALAAIAAPAPAPVGASRLAQGAVVGQTVSMVTPNVYDGQVSAVVTVGNTVVVGGTFSLIGQMFPYLTMSRSYLFAFDRTTGVVDTGFVPVLDGPVEALEPGPDGTSVFVAGNFGTVNGIANRSIARLDLATGQMVPGFDAVTSGAVHDISIHGNTLYLGGNFWSVNNVSRTRMAAIDATTGALDPNFTIATTQPRVSVDWIDKIVVSPQGDELVITGNFMAVDGQSRAQIARIDVSGPSPILKPWSTQRFVPVCGAAFWTHIRDVEYSPAGDYFVVVTTGGPGGSSLCDTASRWETAYNGPNAVETWADYTGGDTLTGVAVSDVAIYVGGHQRWLNNHTGSNLAGPGAVVRNGIAALDPINGLPLTWNPGMQRNIAVWDIDLTDVGIYYGHDSAFVGGQYRPNLAHFALGGGPVMPVVVPDTLPTTLYTGQGSVLSRRSFTGAAFGTAAPYPGVSIDWSTVSDAFVEAGKLYTIENGTLRSRPFTDAAVGSATTEPSWTAWPNVTAATWYRGRLYYVESTSNTLRYRYFSLQSGIVGSQTFSLASTGITWSNIAAMDVVGDRLFYATTTGDLWAVDFVNGAIAAGTRTLLSGPTFGDGRNWANSALFFLTTDTPPTVTINTPAQGSTVDGTITISATATDAEGVASVAFAVDGTPISTDTTAADGFSATLDTTTRQNGAVTITATATDTVGAIATGSITVTIDNAPPGGDVLYVVAVPGAPTAGELVVRDRLIAAGRTVTFIDDNLATPGAAAGFQMVFIGSSVSTAVVGATFKNLTIPVLVAKPYLLDDMGLTGPTATVDYGVSSTATASVAAPGHPMAAGLVGTVSLTATPREISFGVPGPGATTVLNVGAVAPTFVYRPGANLADGSNAAGCRISTSIYQNVPTLFTNAAWQLFDAAVAYALDGCPPVTAPPAAAVLMVVASPVSLTPAEQAVQARLVGAGQVVSIIDDNVARAADGQNSSFVFISSSVSSGAVQATFRDITKPVWVAKPYLLDDMGMTATAATVDYGSLFGTDFVVVAPAHPLAAGRTGTVTVTSTGTDHAFGVPGAGATVIAEAAGKPTSFVYLAGAVLASGSTAAGCRIGTSVFQTAPTLFTTDGWALFDASAAYAAAGCPAA